MFKKSATKKPTKQDFSALDDAVSELTKQTTALWGDPDKTTKKPRMPQRKARPQTKGKSFDIIHPAQAKTVTKATLKAAHTSKRVKQIAKPISVSPQALLPDHAGKSYNELEDDDASSRQTPERLSDSAEKTPEIINHSGSTLSIANQNLEPEEPAAELLSEDDAVSEEPPKVDHPVEKRQKVTTKSAAHTSLSFTEDKPVTTAGPEGPDPTDAAAQDAAPEPAAYDSGEIHAHNLVKDTEPKRHTPNENQQKPTVFDTNEYHPALHDWSKLERRSGGKWLILLLLLSVLGTLIYVFISDIPLPF